MEQVHNHKEEHHTKPSLNTGSRTAPDNKHTYFKSIVASRVDGKSSAFRNDGVIHEKILDGP
jgi:hypothetical protein